MKIITAAVLFALTASIAAAQNESATVQMQCRKLVQGANNFIGPDETYMNGMACRPVAPATTAAPPAAGPTKPQDQPAPTPLVMANAVVPTGPVSTKVAPGSRVYLEPMNGFETYLVAAFEKKKVQLVPVASADQADYVISGTSDQKKAGWAKIVLSGNVHSDDAASISMTDRRTGAIVFAYAVDKKSIVHGSQTTAEACAKHLQAHIKGGE
jgi:hypothetical protein